MKILFQGPDGAGKTTAAKQIAAYFDLPYYKFSQSKDITEVAEVTCALISQTNAYDCVIDRVKTIDHLIYGYLIDGNPLTPVDIEVAHHVHRALRTSSNRFITVYMYADPEVLWQRLTARGDEAYIEKDHLRQIMFAYHMMFVHMSDVIWVDTTKMSQDNVRDYIIGRIESLEDSVHTPFKLA